MVRPQMVDLKKGKLFVVDGTDSSGKQTVSSAVYALLKENGYAVRKVEYPNYESDSSALVRMYLNGEFGERADDINPYTASSFYAVDRIASYIKDWKSWYEAGDIIIADRYTTSNAIHQASKIHGISQKLDYLAWLWDFEYNKLKLPAPDGVAFLNMPIANSLALMEERLNKFTGSNTKDIHERNADFMRQSYQNACWVAKQEGWHQVSCVTEDSLREKVSTGIPGDLRPIEDITQEVFSWIVSTL